MANKMNMFSEYLPGNTKKKQADLTNKLTLRPVNQKDCKALARIAQEREGGKYTNYLHGFENELSGIEKNADERLLFVAEIENEIIGFGRITYFKPSKSAPQNSAPEGWYLMGVIVDESYQRRGVARELTRERLALLKQRTSKAYFFCNAQNQSSIDLHRKFGFKEVTREFSFPGVSFIGGVGVLYEITFINL